MAAGAEASQRTEPSVPGEAGSPLPSRGGDGPRPGCAGGPAVTAAEGGPGGAGPSEGSGSGAEGSGAASRTAAAQPRVHRGPLRRRRRLHGGRAGPAAGVPPFESQRSPALGPVLLTACGRARAGERDGSGHRLVERRRRRLPLATGGGLPLPPSQRVIIGILFLLVAFSGAVPPPKQRRSSGAW